MRPQEQRLARGQAKAAGENGVGGKGETYPDVRHFAHGALTRGQSKVTGRGSRGGGEFAGENDLRQGTPGDLVPWSAGSREKKNIGPRNWIKVDPMRSN